MAAAIPAGNLPEPDLLPSVPRRNLTAGCAALTNLPSRPSVDLSFSKLSYRVKDSRTKAWKALLKDLSGVFKPGELTAVMGPSGAGKSTLLNVLAGYKPCDEGGEVLVNGAPRDLRRFRKLSCYIMQDTDLLPHLTVFEAMHVAANLKLGPQHDQESRNTVVQEILVALGLVECSNTLTSKLSGGQRKRLSIGQELVSNPPIMFFDEPTSGLDSTSCYYCISLLKTLAQGGRTIVCSIHQPSARLFEMFDQLYMLADGECMYRGSISGLVPFLSNEGFHCPTYHNPADFAMEVASGEHGIDAVPKLVAANSRISNAQITIDFPHTSPSKVPSSVTSCQHVSRESVTKETATSSWTQFVILLRRSVICTIRDPTLTHLRLSAHFFVGILVGFLYFNIGNDASRVFNNGGLLMVCILFLMFCAMMPTILTFPLENAVFVREHLNSWYSVRSYYFAKSLADMPFQICYSILFLTVVYFMTSQPAELSRFLMILLLGVLTSLVAQSVGLLVGTVVRLEQGVVLGPVITLPITMFAGFFVSFSTIPSYLRWLSYLSYMRYSFEGFSLAIYGYERARLECNELYCHFRSPTKFLQQLEMLDGDVWVDVAALSLYLVIVKLLTYLVLRFNIRFY